jgi:P4 family phage/plasmid primase-like protien
MNNIRKEDLIHESIQFNELYVERDKRWITIPEIVKLLKQKTALRYSKSFPKNDQFFMYNPGLGVYMEFSPNELIVLIHKIFGYSNINPPNLNVIESIAKGIRFSHDALFGEPIYDRDHLVFTNGLYDLRSNEMKAWTPDIFQTLRLPFSYIEGAQCDKFKKFIHDFCGGHEDRINFLRSWMWAILRPWTEGHVLLYIMGPGATGKTQFVNILTALVGRENTLTTTLKDLHTDRFEASNLRGKQLCIMNDTEYYKGDMSVIKQIVGGDHLRGRLKNINGAIEVRPECLVIIVGNYPLGSRDTSGALARRFRVLLADNISKERTDLLKLSPSGEWSGILASELPGIAAWVLSVNKNDNSIEKAKQYLINTDKLVPSLSEVHRESFESFNPIVSWIREEIEPGEGAFVGFTMKRDLKSDLEVQRRRTLYPTFKMWAERREIKSIGHRSFTSDLLLTLRNEGYMKVAKIRRTEGMFIEGIRIKDLAYTRDHVYGSTLDLPENKDINPKSPLSVGYQPPEKKKEHPALISDLYKKYMEMLGSNKIKIDLNREVRSYFSKMDHHIEEKLQLKYFQGIKDPSDAYRESFLKVLRRGIQSVAKFGAIPYTYKHMGISPRISPISYGNSINNVKRLIKEEAYSYMGQHASLMNARILDLDLKSCFTSIILGLYPKGLEVLQSAIETTGLWNYIHQEFIKEKKEQWYNKASVKICVYSSFFQGGGNAMIQGMLEQHRKDLGLTPQEFRDFPEYERFYESSRNIAEVMLNSSVILDFRRISEEIKRAHLEDYLVGPTGHAYKVTEETFSRAYSNFLQSFEFALIADTTLKVIQGNKNIELLGHFHDGNVLMIPDADLQESIGSFEALLEKLGYSLGLAYKQKIEIKNQWPE